jgi:signal transduction histidine kinase
VVEERNRIARDLHDSVIQDLFAVGLGLQGLAGRLDTEGDRAVLDEGVDRLDAAVDALRSYVFELRDTGTSLPLADRLQELVSRMGSVYPSRIRLTIEGVEGHSGPDDDAMMLMATEALSNALRHAGAENVSVTLSFEDAALTLEVADDGSGFDPASPSRGMGLSNLRSRVASLGGSVSIRSRSDDGTMLRLEIPRRRA